VNKVIISCAVTGSVHTPSMSEYLPITPDEIASQSIAAAGAGASVLHLHARDPKSGRPTNQFRAGHRICIEITSMDVPTGTGAMTNVEYIPYHVCSSKTVTHRIYRDAVRSSHLLLSIIPQAGAPTRSNSNKSEAETA
jgi:uncharacterized protein (DUF849 family)